MGEVKTKLSKKKRAIMLERRFVLFSTPLLGLISVGFFLLTNLSIWFGLIPLLGCVMGICYILWNTRAGEVINDIWTIADLIYWCYLGICALIDLAGWIIGIIGVLLAIGWIR